MIQYTSICLRDGELCYKMLKTMTEKEFIEQKIFWHVTSLSQLLQRWNQQVESGITKLKWIYYE